MKKILLTILLLFALVQPAFAIEATETQKFTFTYDTLPLPEGYRIYRADGEMLCQIDSGVVEAISCDMPALPYGNNAFYLTAFAGDEESEHSNIALYDKKLGVPVIINIESGGVVININ